MTILVLFVVTVSMLTYILRIFELYYSIHPLTETVFLKQAQFFNLFYFIIITLTTVGYGDIQPETIPGKIIIMFCALWGAVMISLVVVAVSKVFDLGDK